MQIQCSSSHNKDEYGYAIIQKYIVKHVPCDYIYACDSERENTH